MLIILSFTNRKKFGYSDLAKTIAISLPFAAIWAIPNLLRPENMASYSSVGQQISGVFLPTLILGWGPAFLLVCYWAYKESPRFRRGLKIKMILWIISIVLFSVAGIARSFWIGHDSVAEGILSSLGILEVARSVAVFALAIEIPLFIAIIITSVQVFRDLKDRKQKFVFLWMVVFGLLILAPGEILYLFGGKIHSIIWVPISILAAEGLMELNTRIKISNRKLLALIFAISLPTVFLITAYSQTQPRYSIDNPEQCCFYYSIDETEAFLFLSNQPRGVVMASIETGTWLPANTGQKTLLHIYPENFVSDFDEKMSDYTEFYSPGTGSVERLGIIDKYGVQYVFLGPSEKELGLEELDETFLAKVFESELVSVYKVRLV